MTSHRPCHAATPWRRSPSSRIWCVRIKSGGWALASPPPASHSLWLIPAAAWKISVGANCRPSSVSIGYVGVLRC